MKKGSIILGTMMIAGLTMYGAWCMYKKMCPECAEEMKDNVEDMIKKKEKKMSKMAENMM